MNHSPLPTDEFLHRLPHLSHLLQRNPTANIEHKWSNNELFEELQFKNGGWTRTSSSDDPTASPRSDSSSWSPDSLTKPFSDGSSGSACSTWSCSPINRIKKKKKKEGGGIFKNKKCKNGEIKKIKTWRENTTFFLEAARDFAMVEGQWRPGVWARRRIERNGRGLGFRVFEKEKWTGWSLIWPGPIFF